MPPDRTQTAGYGATIACGAVVALAFAVGLQTAPAHALLAIALALGLVALVTRRTEAETSSTTPPD
jgi:hypothetical protein